MTFDEIGPPPSADREGLGVIGNGQPVVLAVDDQASNILTIYELFKGEYEVCAATSGEDAFAFCRKRRPDVILLDVGLPGMDGYEVCRRLKADPATREIPIVFVTASGDPVAEVKALDYGAADFIAKPYHEKIVRARVRTQMALKLQTDQLRAFATTDGLTGLANRRSFDQALGDEWRRAIRDRAAVSMLMLDVDHFKQFNDRYGHQAGDQCLQSIASAIKSFARRPGDIAARYGGEEIVILLPRGDEDFVARTAETVRSAIMALAIPHAGNPECGWVVTASIGTATLRPLDHGHGPESLVAKADEMLYEAKRSGRNRVMSPPDLPIDPVAAIPVDEERRIAAVNAYQAAHAGARAPYLDDIARLAAIVVGTPIGLVSLIGRDKQFFAGRYGLDADATSRDVSFCAHAINGDMPMIVADAEADPRFVNNGLVTGEPGIRFYAGAPLISAGEGPRLGALCVIDKAVRPTLTPDQKRQLSRLATLAMDYIERYTADAD